MVDWLTASLSHLGFREHYRPVPLAVGLGEDANAYFWIAPLYFSEQEVEALTDAEKGAVTKALGRNHIAFEAKSTNVLLLLFCARDTLTRKKNGELMRSVQIHSKSGNSTEKQ